MQRKENVDLREIIIFSRTRKHQKFFAVLIKKSNENERERLKRIAAVLVYK